MTIPKVTWSKDKADAALAPYREAKELASAARTPEERTELAMLLLHASRIPGMCPAEKTMHLWMISHNEIPRGDVVEIGTWWGKSALVLLLLARRYGIGNVLCVDPWSDDELAQGVPSVDEASAALSAEEAFEVFKMNLLPYVGTPNTDDDSDLNYMRMTSLEANEVWRGSVPWQTDEFGQTHYKGIALLHIDGNHAYDKVKQDIEMWTPLVVPGGWIVLDDYDWRHGDGPRRAANEYLLAHPETMRHFVAGGAMFVQVPV